jgi:hypothetical protein
LSTRTAAYEGQILHPQTRLGEPEHWLRGNGATRDSRILFHGGTGVAPKLAGIECRYREHLIDSDGFCHRVHHALKAALQFLIPATVHHLYYVVILSGNQRFDSGDWS